MSEVESAAVTLLQLSYPQLTDLMEAMLDCLAQTYSGSSLSRLLWLPSKLSLHQVVLTERCHSSQNTEIGPQLQCPYSECFHKEK